MYLHEKRCLFLHPAKTAGSSIERALNPDGFGNDFCDRNRLFGLDPELGIYLQHASAETARQLLGQARYGSSYRFTAIRDPFERLISVYNYIFSARDNPPTFREFILSLPGRLEQSICQRGVQYSPQHLYVLLDGLPTCHRIVRFDALATDFRMVCQDIALTRPLQHVNRQRYEQFDLKASIEDYDRQTREIVRSAYALDFEILENPQRFVLGS